LNRTYRMILQEDYALPRDLVERIRLAPAVESAHAIDIAEAEVPKPQLATQASLERKQLAGMIYLPYAHALTKGVRDVKIAVLDTGVDLDHPELNGKIVDQADFVNLEGLDTTEFIGDVKGYDNLPEDEVGHGTHVSGIIAARGRQMDEGSPRVAA